MAREISRNPDPLTCKHTYEQGQLWNVSPYCFHCGTPKVVAEENARLWEMVRANRRLVELVGHIVGR